MKWGTLTSTVSKPLPSYPPVAVEGAAGRCTESAGEARPLFGLPVQVSPVVGRNGGKFLEGKQIPTFLD